MYRDIERIYKNESPYNIIKKKLFFVYATSIFISLIFNFYNKFILIFLVFIIMLIKMKSIIEKVLNTKLDFCIDKKEQGKMPLSFIIKTKENKLFKNYSIKNNLYNEKSLLCIVEHYRIMIKTKLAGENLLAILSIIIPVLLLFYKKDGFDFNGLANALPYLIIFSIMIIMLYYLYSKLMEVKKILKGEDNMIERLEEIFSELYIECINKGNDNKNKKQIKKNKSNFKNY